MIKVVVFGGSGFLGGHVVDALSSKGYDVVVFDIKKSNRLPQNAKMVVGDILDQNLVTNVMHDCNIVYNFAGIASLDEAQFTPLDTVRYNILGNTILLESARKNKIERFVYASSLYVYSDQGSNYSYINNVCLLHPC
ncbi:MAG: NAD(P)-dependent oxidoreductase [Oligoflexia bacterium]|nr:NAD(P)-dependent oxidoreductase [Oligoflexia bacterium]